MKRLTILFLGMLLAALSSCVTAEYEVQPVIPEGLKEVSFRVSVPAVPVTRAIGETEENTIRTIDVLAFRVDDSDPQNVREYFDYYSPGKLQSGAGTKNQTFVAKARIKDNKQRFILIANAREKVEQVVAGALLGTNVLKEDLLALLEYTNPGISSDHKWAANSSSDFTPFPMWGESGALVVTGTTHTIGSISLLRMVAKIDVLLADLDLPDVTARRDFKLSEVHLYNTKDNGRIAPDDDVLDYNDIMELIVTDPTLPDVPATFLGPLSWAVSDDISLTNEIYLPEASAVLLSGDALEATCLVIGGYYSADEGLTWDPDPTFYRVDFLTTDKTERRALLRNHRYEVKIVRVIGRGYTDKETAFRSKPVNLEAEVLEWNDGGMTHVEFDGTNYLFVNKGAFNLWREQQTDLLDDKSNQLVVETDVPDGWRIADINYDTGGGWLSTSIQNGPSGRSEVVLQMLQPNETGLPRTAYIIIKAGRLNYTVKVTQSNETNFSIRLVDQDGNDVRELFFSPGNGSVPVAAQNVYLTYSPVDAPLDVNYSYVSNIVMDLSDGDEPASIPSGGTGYEIYSIKPKAFTADEISASPFLSKTARIRFEIEHPTDKRLASVLLYCYQKVYNLTTTVSAMSAPMTGATYAVTFSTNTSWEAYFEGANADTPVAVSPMLGSAGNNQVFQFRVPLVTTGSARSFNLVFKSPTGEFTDKTVTVNCPMPYLTISPTSIALTTVANGTAAIAQTFTVNTNIPMASLSATVPSSYAGFLTSPTILSQTQARVTIAAATSAAQWGTFRVSAGSLYADVSITRQEKPFALSTGRIVAAANARLNGTTGAETMNWAQAVGVSNAMNTQASSGSLGLNYAFYQQTGCAVYWEGSSDNATTGTGKWRAPTQAEALEIMAWLWGKGEVTTTTERYWTNQYQYLGSSCYAYTGRMNNVTTGTTSNAQSVRTAANYIRCVRNP